MFMLANLKNNVKGNKVMGIYLVKNYEKNKNRKFDLKSQKIDKAPHDVGRWQNKNGVDVSILPIK